MRKVQKIFSLVTITGLLSICGYWAIEPTFTRAASDDDDITVTQAVTSEITISSPSNATMSSSIPGVTGNPGSPRTASSTWTVITNNSAGFTLTLAATTTPAMQLDATYNFADYTVAGATSTPDFAWASPASGVAEFGFTVDASTTADTADLFKDDGADCNTGSANAGNSCWYNFFGPDPITVINRSSETPDVGEAEIVGFQTESNAKYLKEGNYVATVWATATAN